MNMTTITLSPAETVSFGLLVAWTLIWKGAALWKSARRNDKVWFIVLLVINTAGILEILYIFVFSKREDKSKQG